MLQFQVKELIKAKGMKSPYRKFIAAGIGHTAIKGYITGKRKKINLAHMEVLCTLLRCTPDKLFTWTPDQQADDYPQHPLQPLKKKNLLDVDALLSTLSPEEIERRLKG